MARRSIFTQILIPFLVVILAAVMLATWDALTSMHRLHLAETSTALEVRGHLLERQFSDAFTEQNALQTDALCKDLGKLSDSRITIILPSGKVVGDTNEDPQKMDNHGDRLEVKEALAGQVGHAQRYSHTLHSDWFYVAVPVIKLGKVVGVIRTSTSLAAVDETSRQVFYRVMLGSAVVAVLASLISLILTRRLARPLRQMELGTKHFARGDFEARLPIPDSAELATLAEAMNAMATELRARIQAMDRQRNQLDAVLSSMTEGVLAVDNSERVMSLNPSAANLFGVSTESACGRDFFEIARNPKLQECVSRVLSKHEPFEEEVIFSGACDRCLRVSATPLRDEQGGEMGALLVLNDITELQRLERARSDFVANVSHEIRTPVTSIKGYAETLLNEPPGDTETQQRFFDIIARQADRLCSLVDDILSLAAMERSEASGEVSLERTALRGILDAAIAACVPKASEKGLTITLACDETVAVRANAPLLEQAVINLLDNAIKYSENGGAIEIAGAHDASETRISVRDSGVGIAPEHLPRIFERFYRVDRARSRKLGGTGLGLAIVKHITALHRGQVSVESTPAKGSCFTLHLPVA